MLFLLAALACNSDSDGDGVLDDFDCNPESADLGIGIATWADADGDGFGDGEMIWSCELTDDLAELPGDCDDSDASAYPGADEICDGVDNDCNGTADDNATDATWWYADFDQDGQGAASWGLAACEAPTGYVASDTDCNDADGSVYDGADELCNGVDDNCDGTIDEDTAVDAPTWYLDSDNDGYGDAGTALNSCEQPETYLADNTDCDDGKPHVNPGADEICDGLDNDCDTEVDFANTLPGTYSDLDDVFENAPDGTHVCIGEGTFTGSGYYRSESLYLHGAGAGRTLINADYDSLVEFDGGDFALTELEVVNAVAQDNYGYGGVVEFEDSGDLLLRDVKFTDGGCDTTYYCYAGIAYWDDGGELVADNVEVDGFVYDGSNYTYSGMYGMFYGYYTDFYITDMEIHDVDVSNVRYNYSLSVYQEYGDLTVDGLHLHDNSIEAERVYGIAVYVDEAYTPVYFNNVVIEDNTVYAERYGFTLGVYLDDAYGGSVIRNLAVLNNNATYTEYAYVYGLALYGYYGDHEWSNVLVAGNTITSEGYGYVYGGLAYHEYGAASLVNADMVDNTFVDFDYVYGSGVYGYDTDLSVWNTNFVNNDFGSETYIYGVFYAENTDLVEGYNNVWSHASDEGYVYNDDDGDLGLSPTHNVNPGYTDAANGDFTLASGSPLIDAGSPDVLDADGSVSDVGAYGGPYGDSW